MKYVSDTFCSLFAISVNKSYERVIILYVSLRLKEIDYDAAHATTRRTTNNNVADAKDVDMPLPGLQLHVREG